MVGLSDKVAERRRILNISQAELARRVGVHQTTIGFIERGEKLPSLDVLLRLQEALGVLLIPAPETDTSPSQAHQP